MVATIDMWINRFPPTDGISMTIIPRTLVTGLLMNYKNIALFILDCTYKHKKNMTMLWEP